jgi:hypothetical protein
MVDLKNLRPEGYMHSSTHSITAQKGLESGERESAQIDG